MRGMGGPVSAMALALLLGGCQAGVLPGASTGELATSVASASGFIPGVPKGYQCPLVPNGFDPAGSIYRIDKTGTYYRVKDLSREPAFAGQANFKSEVPISNYVLSDTQNSSAGLSLELLKSALPGLTAGSSLDLKRNIKVDITVEDMVGEVIDDTVADRIVEWLKANVQAKRGSKYFLVRETVKAGAVSYSLRQEDLAKFGGQAKLETLASGRANVTVRDNNGRFEIKQKFSPNRITVCHKSAEIVFDQATAGVPPAVSLRPVDETSVPAINSVGG